MKLMPVIIEDLKDVPTHIAQLQPVKSETNFKDTASSVAKDVIQWIKSSPDEGQPLGMV